MDIVNVPFSQADQNVIQQYPHRRHQIQPNPPYGDASTLKEFQITSTAYDHRIAVRRWHHEQRHKTRKWEQKGREIGPVAREYSFFSVSTGSHLAGFPAQSKARDAIRKHHHSLFRHTQRRALICNGSINQTQDSGVVKAFTAAVDENPAGCQSVPMVRETIQAKLDAHAHRFGRQSCGPASLARSGPESVELSGVLEQS
jgi:hypothetical protein